MVKNYKELLPESLNSYKVNLHCHSDVSDSLTRTFELKDIYKNGGGYAAVAYTDHDLVVKHPELCDDEFVALTGVELYVHSGFNFAGSEKWCHFNAVAIDESTDVQLFWHTDKYIHKICMLYADAVNINPNEPNFERAYEPKILNQMFKKCKDEGYFVIYNHPTDSHENYNDYSKYENIDALEIMNGSCIRLGGEEYNGNVYDELLRCGKRICCVGSDDNHNCNPSFTRKSDSLAAYTVVKAEKISYEDIMGALTSGLVYASEGPEIYGITYEDGYAKIKTSPARKICLNTGIGRADAVFESKDGAPVTEAVFKVEKSDIYFRFSITDTTGKRAYSNAYFTDELDFE